MVEKSKTKRILGSILYAIGGFLLFFVLLVLFFYLTGVHDAVQKPYSNFLQATGYYTYVYNPDCVGRCLGNILHNLPRGLLLYLPIIAILIGVYYFLDPDKETLKKQWRQLFSRTKEMASLKATRADRKIQDAFFTGLVIAFLVLASMFLLIPLGLFLLK